MDENKYEETKTRIDDENGRWTPNISNTERHYEHLGQSSNNSVPFIRIRSMF